jgi:perosamine synthetase
MITDSTELNFINQIEPYLTENEVRAMSDYLRSGGWLTEFEKTQQFERMIADFLGVKHAVAITNGTVGLYLALLAVGIGRGDTVVVPDYTMIASPNAVRWANADVLLCDTERDTLCLDLDKVRLKENTRALMHVSVNGRAGDIDRVIDFCRDHGLFLIEDACQAFGSKSNDRFLGTFGDLGVFSFTPHKIITTGQGGAVVTNNDELYEKLRRLKDFSRVKPGVDVHTGMGYNFKFTDLQSVIGIEQLKLIDFRIKRKKELYKEYMDQLNSTASFEFLPIDLSQTVPWFVDVIICNIPRDRVIAELKKNKIGSRPFYPPIHTQEPYQNCGGDYVVTSDLAPRGLWLPSSIGLKEHEITRVTSVLQKTFAS